MTQPGPPAVEALAAQLVTVRGTVASVTAQVAQAGGDVRRLAARLSDEGVLALPGRVEELGAAVEELAGQVAGLLEGDAPARVTAPRWDAEVPAERRAAQLRRLRTWVDGVLVPGYVRRGPFTLRDCWPRHPAALWYLSTIAVKWQAIYQRESPPVDQALEWHDRWLPGAMRLVGEALRDCTPAHQG